MNESTRAETIRRVYHRLHAMNQHPPGRMDRSFVDEYHHQLDRLGSVGEDVEEFRVRPEDWVPDRYTPGPGGTIGSLYRGPLRGDEEWVVPLSRFRQRFAPAYSHVEWLIRQEEEKRLAERSIEPSAILDARRKVLATLVDAYLKDQSEFHVLGSGDGREIYHPGLPGRQYTPEWSHVEALAREGHLLLASGGRPNTWTIGIPSSVLAEVQRDAPSLVSQPGGERRVEGLMTQVFNFNYFGGSQNVAVASQHVSQAITHGIQPGDLNGLFAALRALGISDEDLPALQTALEEDEQAAGRRSIGARVIGWMSGVVGKAAQQAAATGTLAGAERLPELYNEVHAALQAHTG